MNARKQAPSEASVDISRRDLTKATGVLVYTYVFLMVGRNSTSKFVRGLSYLPGINTGGSYDYCHG